MKTGCMGLGQSSQMLLRLSLLVSQGARGLVCRYRWEWVEAEEEA